MVQILKSAKKMSYNDMEVLAAVSLLSSKYYKTPEEKVRAARKYLNKIKRELPKRFNAAMARVKSSGGGYPAGEVGETHATYPEFDNTVQKSYTNNPSLKTQDKESHPSSEYNRQLCIQKQRENGITDDDYINNVCSNEALGAPKDYSEDLKYGNRIAVYSRGKFIGYRTRQTKQASVTSNEIPAYITTNKFMNHNELPIPTRKIKQASMSNDIPAYLVTMGHDELPPSKSTKIKSAKKLEVAEMIIRDAIIHRNPLTFTRENTNLKQAAKNTKKDERPAWLALQERYH